MNRYEVYEVANGYIVFLDPRHPGESYQFRNARVFDNARDLAEFIESREGNS